MNHMKLKWVTVLLALTVVLMLGACKKKVAPAPPPPPPPATPTASLNASPGTIEKGQSTTLTWQTANATDVNIEGIGAVQASGSRQASPAESTTYTLTAKGPGGTQTASARVTVNMPPPPPPPPPPGPTEEELFSQNAKDIYFNYDKADIRADQQSSLQADAQFLAQHPNIKFTISGHCDERGSIEYNLALGENRATSAKQALVTAGVGADRIQTVSYGKERPFCSAHDEECWQQNRRAHFVYQK